jgi:stage V sporulation protein R
VVDDAKDSEIIIGNIHDEIGYKGIREGLAQQYNLSMNEPNIQVFNVDVNGDRSLTLHHIQHDHRPLGDSTQEVLRHLHCLWQFDVHMETRNNGKLVKRYSCPLESTDD